MELVKASMKLPVKHGELVEVLCDDGLYNQDIVQCNDGFINATSIKCKSKLYYFYSKLIIKLLNLINCGPKPETCVFFLSNKVLLLYFFVVKTRNIF